MRASHIDMLSAIPAAFAMPRSPTKQGGETNAPRHSGSGDRDGGELGQWETMWGGLWF